MKDISGRKFTLTSEEAAKLVVSATVPEGEDGNDCDYSETWEIPVTGQEPLRLKVSWENWILGDKGLNPNPPARWFAWVVGEKLGGFVGISLGFIWEERVSYKGGRLSRGPRKVLAYHIGTPNHAQSERFIKAMGL